MSQPHYAEFAPRPALRDLVHCIWTFTGPADDEPQRIAPDGRPELIVHRGNPYIERDGDHDVIQPDALFAGQLTEPLVLVAPKPAEVIGVRFQPFAARAFMGRNADAATDRRLDLATLHGDMARGLVDDVRAASTIEAAVEIVQDYVEGCLTNVDIDEDVRAQVLALIAEAPVPIAPFPERLWQRRFRAEVGVSARMLESVLRFRRVFDAIERPEKPDWVSAALVAGYFDQPQMARDFRRFLGCTAREWARQREGLAKALTEAPDSYKNEDRQSR